MQEVILKPLITERSLSDAQKGSYSFVVAKNATKVSIRGAVQRLFNVTVLQVHTSNIKGRKIRFTRKGKTITDLSYKKARVHLRKGEKIAIFEEKSK